jgi:hypothetical protein
MDFVFDVFVEAALVQAVLAQAVMKFSEQRTVIGIHWYLEKRFCVPFK